MSFQYTLFDTLLDPVFVLNAEQKIIYCNEAAAGVTGLTARKLMRGLTFDSVFSFTEPFDLLKNLSLVKDATPYKELSFSTAGGQSGKVQLTVQAISAPDEETHWIVFIRDVTLEERLQLKYRMELEQKEGVIGDLENAKMQLEDYSKNLEKKVTERTRELSRLNQMMTALLDSLGQGFFVFDSNGLCLEINSKACTETIECRPAGRQIWDVLKIPENKVQGFQRWMLTVFSEMLPFADLAPLGPKTFTHTEGKDISLDYFPLRSAEGTIEGVVVVASDITDLLEAQRVAEKEKAHAKLIIHLVQSKKEISRFTRDSEERLQTLQLELAKAGPDLESVYRELHTLKGGASYLSLQEMAGLCHRAESQVNSLMSSAEIDDWMGLRATTVQIETAFASFQKEAKEILGAGSMAGERQIEISLTKAQFLISQFRQLPGGLQNAPLLTRELLMEPVGPLFDSYKDLTFKLAEKEGKKLKPVAFHQKDVPIFPEPYANLFATFVHLFRNCVDHGLEYPEVRTEQGKDPEGSIEVFFAVQGNQLCITVTDDGAGIDPSKIRAKLQEKGISPEGETDTQVIQHIFDSQFSTRDTVTETSGRGVGMDAIKMAALDMGGSVEVESTVGLGSRFTIRIPYYTELPSGAQKLDSFESERKAS